ncbi:YajG family lipoprotein [Sulfurospirillum arcachonense]|uniref:YajG family lipoprotein n=1 Tax=Sulfurospirillum arcachonense TaxID=57666 RepID=UPI0004696EEB|nr:YajG family lipoprotein [Sulfurospirillum arcachonense]
MKVLTYIIVFAFLLGGCSYKNEAISLNSYKAQYNGPTVKEKKTVYLESVIDDRKIKRVIGLYEDNGQIKDKFFSEVDFAKKYQEGLNYAFEIAGFSKSENADNANLHVKVLIKKIELIYNNKNFNTNLKGEIEVEVIVQKDGKTITQNFRQKNATWIKPSFKSKDLEPFLYTLFVDNVNNIAARLTSY